MIKKGTSPSLTPKDKPVPDLSVKLASIDRQVLDTRASLYTLKRRKYASHLALKNDALSLLGKQCLAISNAGAELVELIPQAPIYANEAAPSYDGTASSIAIVEEVTKTVEAMSIDSFRIPTNSVEGHSRTSSSFTPSPASRASSSFTPFSIMSSPKSYQIQPLNLRYDDDGDQPAYSAGYGDYINPNDPQTFRGSAYNS